MTVAKAHAVATMRCTECGHPVSASTLPAVTKAYFDHVVYAHPAQVPASER